MRAADMIIGDEYALSGRRDLVRVTVLETDPDVCGRGWVRVRFEEGVLAGEVKRVSSQRIFTPWEEREDPRPRRQPTPRPSTIRGPWPPEPGKPIFWHRTGEVRWLVEDVDRRNRRATITSELVGQRQMHTVSWVELQPFQAEVMPAAVEKADGGGVLPHLETARPEPAPEPEPPRVRERERLADLGDDDGGPLTSFVDRLVFSPEALERYRRRFVKSGPQKEARRRLYRELHRRGRLYRRPLRAPGARDEYLRLRVDGRFDVVLRERPDEGSAIYIDEQDLRIISARRKHSRTRTPGENAGKRAA